MSLRVLLQLSVDAAVAWAEDAHSRGLWDGQHRWGVVKDVLLAVRAATPYGCSTLPSVHAAVGAVTQVVDGFACDAAVAGAHLLSKWSALLGGVALFLGDVELAIRSCNEALKHVPHNVVALHNLALAFEVQGETAHAHAVQLQLQAAHAVAAGAVRSVTDKSRFAIVVVGATENDV